VGVYEIIIKKQMWCLGGGGSGQRLYPEIAQNTVWTINDVLDMQHTIWTIKVVLCIQYVT